MNEKLKTKLELFTANTQDIKQDFVWHHTNLKRLAALLYAAENKSIDCMSIRECHELIKKNTGFFSTFRGNMAICISAMLSLAANRDNQITNTLTVYNMMKDEKFRASDYLVLASYQIAANVQPDKYKHIIERSRAFYDGMKENNWFITGRDDYIFSAMLGLSDIDTRYGVARMKQLHIELKRGFISGNSVQSLTQVLVLSGETPETVQRVIKLWDAFKERNLRLDREYTLSSLGVLAMLPDGISSIVDNVSEAYEFMRTQKGFGVMSITKSELLLFAAAMVAFTGIEDAKSSVLTAALSTSLTNIIIAQQAATATMVASTSAATASS